MVALARRVTMTEHGDGSDRDGGGDGGDHGGAVPGDDGGDAPAGGGGEGDAPADRGGDGDVHVEGEGGSEAAKRRRIQAALEKHTDGLLEEVRERWGDAPHLDPWEGPHPWNDEFPDGVGEFMDRTYPFVAGCAVTDEDGRVLLVQQDRGDGWQTPGGPGGDDESPVQTAARETMNAAGVVPDVDGLLFTRTMRFDYGHEETLPVPLVLFTATREQGDPEEFRKGRVRDVRWFEADEVPADTESRDVIVEHFGE